MLLRHLKDFFYWKNTFFLLQIYPLSIMLIFRYKKPFCIFLRSKLTFLLENLASVYIISTLDVALRILHF